MKKTISLILLTLGFIALLYFLIPTHPEAGELVKAEELVEEHPDSALLILENISTHSNLLRKDQALYALLMTQIKQEKGEKIESDSLIRIAVDYYTKENDLPRKAYSLYYAGLVYKNLSENKQALNAYQDAHECADKIQDYKLLSRILDSWGYLVQQEMPYDNAINKFKKGLEYSEISKDTLKQIEIIRHLGWSYVWKEDTDRAMQYYHRGIKLAKAIGNTELLSAFYHNLGVVYCQEKQYDLAMEYVNKFLELNRDSVSKRSSWYLKGSIFLQQQKYDSARYYFEGRGMGNTYYTKAGYYDALSTLEEKLKNYKQSLAYRNLCMLYMDSIGNYEKDNQLIELQKKYDYSLVINKNNQLELSKRNMEFSILIICLIFLIVIAILFFYYNKRKLKREEIIKMKDDFIRQSLMQLQDKTILLQKHQEELHNKEWELNLYLQKAESLKSDILQKEEELKMHQQKERELKEQIFKMDRIVQKIESLDSLNTIQRYKSTSDIMLSPQELANLEEAVNLCFDNFASRLKADYPKLTADDIYLCCLLKMKIPNGNILILLNINQQTLKKRKYRIKHEKIETQNLDEFLLSF